MGVAGPPAEGTAPEQVTFEVEFNLVLGRGRANYSIPKSQN